MTNQQYKNITEWTLKNMDAAERDDSLTVARAILNNCGVSLPEGGMQEILDALQSGDYMWWRPCTYEQAKSFADEGQPVVGVDDGRLIVIVPSDIMSDTMSDAVSGESSAAGGIGSAAVISGTAANAVTAQDASSIGSSFVLSAEALTAEQRSVMQFYASGCSSSTSTTTTTVQPEERLNITGLPDSNTIPLGSSFELVAYEDDPIYTVDAEWTYDCSIISICKEFKYHMHIAHMSANSIGSTVVTARYGTRSYSFSITVGPMMQIYLAPANHHKEYTKLDGTLYPVSEMSERKNMENVAARLESFLNMYWVDVMVTDIHATTGQYHGRPQEADQWIVDKEHGLYLALHTNAGAEGGTTARGSSGYYNAIREAGDLALALVDAVDPILPNGSNRSDRTIPGIYESGSESDFGELSEPEELNIPSVILEFGFHDNPLEADFFIKNESLLAETVGNVLVEFYGLVRR